MEDNRIYVGIIYLENGWNKMYSDGNKNYTFEPFDEEKDVPQKVNKEKR